jgi:hypothetical protein
MPKQRLKNIFIVTRREFLKQSSFILAGLTIDPRFAFSRQKKSEIRVTFGIVTDFHYADSAPKRNRYFRESISKMEECVDLMIQMKVDVLISYQIAINLISYSFISAKAISPYPNLDLFS